VAQLAGARVGCGFQVLLEPHDVMARYVGSVIMSKELGKPLEMRFGSPARLRIVNPLFPCPFLDELREGGLPRIIAYPTKLK
jgi:hypothetical protein